jgi:hypothetical protein
MGIAGYFGSGPADLRVRAGALPKTLTELSCAGLSVDEAKVQVAQNEKQYGSVGDYDPVLRAHCRKQAGKQAGRTTPSQSRDHGDLCPHDPFWLHYKTNLWGRWEIACVVCSGAVCLVDVETFGASLPCRPPCQQFPDTSRTQPTERRSAAPPVPESQNGDPASSIH